MHSLLNVAPVCAQFHGCPDTDGDSIPDKDDARSAQNVWLSACSPERYGDGFSDKDDACRDKKGLGSVPWLSGRMKNRRAELKIESAK